MTPEFKRAAFCVLAGWSAIFAAIFAFRPLIPVDETRYLSVAWEMLQQGRWILPTLNFEPYSHKPPLLFWLIRASWEVFGVGITGPRIMIFLVVIALAAASVRLARRLFPQDPQAMMRTLLALAAMPMFLTYASVIMFDSLLALFVVIAMGALWRAARGYRHGFAVLGLMLGLGILAKGPVAFVYMLPAALLAPLWTPGQNWRLWYAGVGAAFVAGACIGLAWAIPAALQGGDAYAQKIFITQSTGRIMRVFDHAEPFWFYLPVLLAFLAAFVTWPALWPALWPTLRRAAPGLLQDRVIRFLLCWTLPAFLFFTIIVSKQIHYLMPILPGFALLIAAVLPRLKPATSRSLILPLLVLVLPSVVVIVFEAMHRPFFDMTLDEASEHLGYAHVVFSGAIFWWARRGNEHGHEHGQERTLMALACASMLLVAMVHIQLGQRFLPRFDIMPLARAAVQYKERPMAATPKYDGEYGFLFGATAPIHSIGRDAVGAWFEQNPGGVLIGRYKPKNLPGDYNVLFRQQFRTEEVLVILEKKP